MAEPTIKQKPLDVRPKTIGTPAPIVTERTAPPPPTTTPTQAKTRESAEWALFAKDKDRLSTVTRDPAKGGSGLDVRMGALRPKNEVTPKEIAAYRELNKAAAAECPPLASMLRDPDAFVANLKERFAAQKLKTPNDPYQFDFGDYGVPALKSMGKALDKEVVELAGKLKQVQSSVAHKLIGRDQAIADLTLGIEHMKDLRKEVGELVGKGSVSYRRLQELSYHVSEALGTFDMPMLKVRDRLLLEVDRYMQGYASKSIGDVVRRYRENDFTMFDKQSPVHNFNVAEPAFVKAFFNPDKLEMISLPVCDELTAAPFNRLLNYDIYIMGVTGDPIGADGFVRPGGDFWVHDLRHASAMHAGLRDYEKAHDADEATMNKLRKRADVWRQELHTAMADIKDPELKHAVDFFLFNFHHDRGYPLLPSSYTVDVANNMIPRLLYMMLRMTNQDSGFKTTLTQAFDWLKDFWLQRLPQERDIVGPSITTAAATAAATSSGKPAAQMQRGY